MSGCHVIFDCDGVLIDSEWLACQVESEMLGEYGIDLAPREIARRFIGSTVKKMFAEIEADAGRALPADFFERYAQAIKTAFSERLKAMRGIEAVLAQISANRSVASNSPIGRVRMSLEVTGLARFFDPARVYSADMVAEPKPAPDLHLHILRATGARAEATIVIEDSPSGVAAARAAGVRAVGFSGASHCTDGHADLLLSAGAERVFTSMDEVAAYLADINVLQG